MDKERDGGLNVVEEVGRYVGTRGVHRDTDGCRCWKRLVSWEVIKLQRSHKRFVRLLPGMGRP